MIRAGLSAGWIKIATPFFFAAALNAQQIAGRWQGTVDPGQKLHVIVELAQATDGGMTAKVFSIDQSPSPFATTKATFADKVLKFTVDEIHASYEGTLSADGGRFDGAMTQGGRRLPLVLDRQTPATAWKTDPSPHTVQMIAVDKDVTLEVLDWGGTGRPLVLLTGLGNDAHVFDTFAPKLSANYHVYGITRRGFGDSSKPAPDGTNYSASRLGDDVLVVVEALHLNKPVLAGHSVAGEELSYIGNKHPDKVSGLIYLDAGYPYALYDEVNGGFMFDAAELRRQLGTMIPGGTPPVDQKKALDDLLAALKQVQKEAESMRQSAEDMPAPAPGPRPSPPPPVVGIMSGVQRFTTISVPALVIFASPHDLGNAMKDNPKARAAMEANDKRSVEGQATAFERQVPSAHVVRIPNANHYVFRSNEADVLREMNTFIATLPAAN